MDARAWDERYAATERVWSAEPNQFVASELGDLPPGRALDLACGEGRNALWLASRGWRVTALDFSAVAVEKGRRAAESAADESLTDRSVDRPVHPPNLWPVDWVVGDALSAVLPAGLDLVVVAYLQLPAEERSVALRRAFATLAPGGTLLVVAHDSSNLTEGTGGPQDPRVLYTAQDVLCDLSGYDVAVVRAQRVPRTVRAADEHGSVGTAWDALVRVRRPAVTAG